MLPIPQYFNEDLTGTVFRVDYANISNEAEKFREEYKIGPAAKDKEKTWLLLIDLQNTFCIPEFELFVRGRSGNGAVDDSLRLCRFIYKNLDKISEITATLDTHLASQIFHPIFFIGPEGQHPAPYIDIHIADLRNKKWKFNPALASQFGITPQYGQQLVLNYVETLSMRGKFELTIWPYHAMQGGIGHALVSSIEEAIFFHTQVRVTQPFFEIKGNRPFTENYSVIGPEILTGPLGETLGSRTTRFVEHLEDVDRLIIAGQAKSHCVASTVSDLLEDIQKSDSGLAKKVYLLEDCTSPVVVENVIDHHDSANKTFERFQSAGMHIIKSTDDIFN